MYHQVAITCSEHGPEPTEYLSAPFMAPSWHCFGDNWDEHTCEPRHRCPDYADYGTTRAERFVGEVWPRVLVLVVMLVVVNLLIAPSTWVWHILVGTIVALLVNRYVDQLDVYVCVTLSSLCLTSRAVCGRYGSVADTFSLQILSHHIFVGSTIQHLDEVIVKNR
jgi:hypothetical protein